MHRSRHLRSAPLAEAEYPRFSDAEMARRRALIETAMAEAGAEHLVFCGYNRAGSAVQWLTQWPVTTEAVGVFSPASQTRCSCNTSTMRRWRGRFADKAETVEWGGESSIRKVIETLEQRGARADRVAIIGPMPFEQHAALAAKFGKIISLNRVYGAAARGEVGGGARLAADRRGLQRRRHGGAARRPSGPA